MQLIPGKVRIMREELAKAGTPKDTDEIRENYEFSTLKSIVTYHVKGELQNRHMHFVLGGVHHVLAGSMELQDDKGDWYRVDTRQAAEHTPCDYYNVRVPEDGPTAAYPGAGPTVGAVSIFYKWVPPHLDVREDELTLLFQNDWFGEGYLKDQTDKKTSPVLRLAEPEQKRFWEIVKRNKDKLNIRDRPVPF